MNQMRSTQEKKEEAKGTNHFPPFGNSISCFSLSIHYAFKIHSIWHLQVLVFSLFCAKDTDYYALQKILVFSLSIQNSPGGICYIHLDDECTPMRNYVRSKLKIASIDNSRLLYVAIFI